MKHSLYGLRQSPLNFFKLLRSALEKAGLKQSKNDPCLFIGKDVICITYVDNCLFWSKDEKSIHTVLDKLKDKNSDDHLELNIEDDVAGFLGIHLKKHDNGSIELLQTGLIDRILRVTNLEEASKKPTPADTTALGTDKDGEEAGEDWSYASVIGMLIYLAGNS